ncbi:MAG: SMC-Scp complex subunit ScpB [Gemmataceae bacterium]|nr:SMC-Scp complex subunit ScpB [Gemmataceae bacterium]
MDAMPTDPLTPDDLSRTYAELLGDEPPAIELEADTTPPPPMRIIEALLFVGGSPLTANRAREILRGLSEEQFVEAITQLNHDYRRQNRPYTILFHDDGYSLTLQPRFRHTIEKLYGGVREARLSTTAVDVLALVAYRQPVTKAEVDNIRGGDSGTLLRQLVSRGLIQVAPLIGGEPNEVAYSTTPRFLEMFDLRNLDDLPKTHDLQKI